MIWTTFLLGIGVLTMDAQAVRSITIPSLHQKEKIVDGFVTEADTSKRIEFATVKLYSLPDSTYKKGIISQEDGGFSFTTPIGKYFLQLSAVGYPKKTLPFEVKDNDASVHLGKINMPTSLNELDAVEIVVQIPPVVQQGDTTVYNADAFKVAEGSALEDLLKKLPGATLDEDNNLLVNGQKITKILMDGKEYMMGDLNTMMKDIPAEMIEKLKVYHRKSEQARATGVDDGNEELVLDLKIKPNMKKGWNGELMAGMRNDKQYQLRASARRFTEKRSFNLNASTEDDGITNNQRLSASFSQNTKKLKITGNTSLNISDRKTWRENSKESFVTDSTSEYSYSKSNSISKNKSLSANVQLEWNPDSATTINFRPSLSLSDNSSNSNSQNESFDTNMKTINSKFSTRPENSKGFSTRGELYMNRRLGKKGRNISLNLQYSFNNTDRKGFYDSQTKYQKYGDSLFIQRQNILTDDKGYEVSVRISYTEPIFKNHNLRLEYSYRNKESDYQRATYLWVDSLADYSELPDSANSRYTTSNYGISQISLSFVGSLLNKINYTLGMRMEYQKTHNLTYFEESTVNEQNRNVTNYFPNFNMSYKINKQSSLRINYSGRSSQPSANDLQPITDNSDPLNIRTGNPNLSPSFSNSVNSQFNWSFPKTRGNINVNLNYGNTMNKVAWLVEYNPETGVRKNSPQNVNGDWNGGGSFSYYTPLDKKNKFSIQSNTSFRYSNRIGFTTTDKKSGSVKTYNRGLNLSERLRGTFRTSKVSLDASAQVTCNTNTYSMRPESNNKTFDYVLGLNTDITLPFNIRWSSDINCRFREGYSGKNNKTKTTINFQASRAFLKNKLFLRFNVYDILKNRETSGRTVGEDYISDWSSSSSEKTYMISLTYKFNKYGRNKKKK